MSVAKNVGNIIGKSTNNTKNAVKKSTKATGNKVGKDKNKANSLVDLGLDAIEAGGSKIVNSSVGKKLKIKDRAKPLVDKVDKDGNVVKSWDNLYTGKKLNPIYSTLGVGAVAAANAVDYKASAFMAPITASQKNVEHGGPPEIMLYDGVGQQSAPNHLNANGSLVFGLHNQRRG